MTSALAAPRRFSLANRRVQANLAQVAGAVVLVAVLVLLGMTLSANLARLNLTAGFGFLLRPAGMPMGESVLPFAPTDSFAWAMVAAGVNTLRVAVAAIVLATVLGTAIGIMRLSANPLLRAITACYVETFRNTPVLLQILVWSALLLKLPQIRQAVSLGDWVFLSQRGVQVPGLALHGGWADLAPAAAAACVAGIIALAAARRRLGRGGASALAVVAALLVLLVALGWGGTLTLERPARRLFGFSGGLTLTPEFCALLLGLTAYAASYIAEVVRSGILSVSKGQWEAARSLGLRDGIIMRRIVLPQALRVMLPPLTSQYVGILKNSSLAVAIGYPDLFWAVSTAINVTGHAVEGVVVLMAGYLLLTLGTSGAMNLWYGRLLRRGVR
jgi:general L-amino acid transport system permease protein